MNGYSGCRLFRPVGQCDETHPVLLQRVKNELAAANDNVIGTVEATRTAMTQSPTKKRVEYPYKVTSVEQATEPPVCVLNNPLNRPNSKLLVW